MSLGRDYFHGDLSFIGNSNDGTFIPIIFPWRGEYGIDMVVPVIRLWKSWLSYPQCLLDIRNIQHHLLGFKPGHHKASTSWKRMFFSPVLPHPHVGLSENVGYIPNEIAIFHRDNDHQPLGLGVLTIFRHTHVWFPGTLYFSYVSPFILAPGPFFS